MSLLYPSEAKESKLDKLWFWLFGEFRIFYWISALLFLASASFIGFIIYVLHHFISKYW